MWQFILDLVVSSVTVAFSWFSRILDAVPGAWSAILTVFTILVICRFLLAPALGGKSDKAKKNKEEDDG